MRLANKDSLITGAGAGMGYAAAHMFSREGSAIAVVDFEETTGIVLMTKAMALDYAAENIRVNCLCPGSTRTAQTEARLKDAADPDAVIASLVAHQAMKRLADPEEIAAAALFLASDESTFVTGTAFAVDAGWTAM